MSGGEKPIAGEPDPPTGLVPAEPDRARAKQDAISHRTLESQGIPERDLPELRGAVLIAEYDAPLPPPQILEGYKSVIPDLPDRLVRAWEDEQRHRHEIEKGQHAVDVRTKDASITDERLRVIFAFILGLAGLGAATVIGVKGHGLAAGIVGGSSLAVIIASFLRRPRRRERGDSP